MREFFELNPIDVLVIYGLAFIVIGAIILTFPRHTSQLRLIRNLPLLATFAILHGALEFAVIWQTQHAHIGHSQDWFIATLLIASFIQLFEFGRRTLWESVAPISFLAGTHRPWLYAMLIMGILAASSMTVSPLAGINAYSRLFLGVPGALLAGFALWGKRNSPISLSSNINLPAKAAAVAFFIYALLTSVIPLADPKIPKFLITESSFFAWTGIPVQVFGMACAAALAIAVMSIVRSMNEESRKREINHIGKLEIANQQLIEQVEQADRMEKQLRIMAVAFSSQESVMITDVNGVIIDVNDAFIEMTGFTKTEAVGNTPIILKSGLHDADFYKEMWATIARKGTWHGEIMGRRKNGDFYPKWLSISAVTDDNGNITHYVGTHADITERKNAEAKINELAFYDPLTKLPNRRLMMDRLELALASSSRNGLSGALLMIDMDNFKSLNDTLGHTAGDEILAQIAIRLTNSVREDDTVARLGGDEFLIILGDLSSNSFESAAQAKSVSEKIIDYLSQPYQLEGSEYRSTPSIGITLFNDHEETINDLLKQADIALYQSKKSGRNTLRFFDTVMQESVNARVAMEKELQKAIENNQFKLHYQVQIDSCHSIIGAEALLRWEHPTKGIISPNAFIPLSEELGLIIPIGKWVVDTACAQIKSWQNSEHTKNLVLAVNVSAKQFIQNDFVDVLEDAIRRHQINPTLLKLELTESLLLDNVEEIIEKMNALKFIGIQLSLDDFGTGYSSLQYLKRLPIDQVKIDQSFVRDLDLGSNDKEIVKTIIAMAHSLNLAVIAEGVETEEQRQFLLNAGCNNYQGYLFSKPVPANELNAFCDKSAKKGISGVLTPCEIE